MHTDIRLPMGLMFSILGLVLTGYGLCTFRSDELIKSLGINVNFWWGLVITGFGFSMLGLFWIARPKRAAA